MSFIDDMKIGRKLIGGFLIVTLILILVAMVGYTNIGTIADHSKKMYNDCTVPMEKIGIIDSNLERMQGNIYKYAYVPESRPAIESAMEGDIAAVNKEWDAYTGRQLTVNEKKQADAFEKNWLLLQQGYRQLMKDAKANDKNAVNTALARGSSISEAFNAAMGTTDALAEINLQKAKALDDESDALAASAGMTMLIATLIAVIAAIGIALYLAKSITGPIERVKQGITDIHQGRVSNRLNMNRKDDLGEMADTLDKFASDFQKYILGTMVMIAEGDFSRNLKPRDDKDEIVPPVKKVIETLRAVNEESNKLSRAAVEGKLSVRGNADQFKGGYWEIIAGLNKTMDNVVAPLNEAMRVSEQYANGDFTARFNDKIKVNGDFKKFRDELNEIGDKVAKALRGINQQVGDLAASTEEANASVEEVSAGSAQVAKNASGVSINAEKATQGIEQVQKAMEDLSRTIQDVATKSEVVAKIVQDTTNFSREGMELAQKTEQGMQGITKSSNDVNQIIGEIKDQMDKISEIVNLITDLANQTNLLALNAAIEAARAGDAGRGFAVVATEVKSLAVESRASAERISEMIDNLQKQTLNAVDAVTSANTGVREGSEALHETLSSFTKIVSSIDKISQNVSEVAAAAEEQAASVQEVTASVHEVGGLMQNTTREATDAAAASEESSAAIDQITKVVANVNTIVDKLTKEVSRFKV
ncbi:MAG: methyl-accepting chemotaxis protein [Methanoregula sp.]|nr:methyl-accepting chemotaxis protein [Methanoregula sp.]